MIVLIIFLPVYLPEIKKSDNMDKDRPDLKKYSSGVPQGPISVNINDWMEKAHGPRVPKPTEQEVPPTRAQQEKAIQEAREAIKQYKERHTSHTEHAARKASLTDSQQECSECGCTEYFYKDDYLCYRCREILDATG